MFFSVPFQLSWKPLSCLVFLSSELTDSMGHKFCCKLHCCAIFFNLSTACTNVAPKEWEKTFSAVAATTCKGIVMFLLPTHSQCKESQFYHVLAWKSFSFARKNFRWAVLKIIIIVLVISLPALPITHYTTIIVIVLTIIVIISLLQISLKTAYDLHEVIRNLNNCLTVLL